MLLPKQQQNKTKNSLLGDVRQAGSELYTPPDYPTISRSRHCCLALTHVGASANQLLHLPE